MFLLSKHTWRCLKPEDLCRFKSLISVFKDYCTTTTTIFLCHKWILVKIVLFSQWPFQSIAATERNKGDSRASYASVLNTNTHFCVVISIWYIYQYLFFWVCIEAWEKSITLLMYELRWGCSIANKHHILFTCKSILLHV